MIKFLLHSNNRDFAKLWLAQLISQFGDRINQLALIGLIAERSPGSVMGLAKIMAFTIIPVFIVQPIAGVLVDRWDRRLTLLICDIARGLLVITIPFAMQWDSIIQIYIIVFLVFCFSRFYIPAKMSIIPDLVKNENLIIANSLVTTTGMIAFVGGCAVGGFLIEKFGSRNGFVIDAITFFISASILFSIKNNLKLIINKKRILTSGREIYGTVKKTIFGEFKESLIYLGSNKEISFIINILFILMAAAGAIYVVLIVFVQQSFQSVTRDLGLLAVFLGIGLFLGVVLYGRFGKRISWYKTIFVCLTLGGFMLIMFALIVSSYPHLFTALAVSLILGLVVGPIFIATNTMVQIVSDEKMRGKVFSAIEIVIHFAFLFAMLFSSWLSQYVERVWILISVGLLFSVIGLLGFLKSQKIGALARTLKDMA